MTHINRRKALSVVAAAPAAVALGGFSSGQPGELAALIRRYWAEIDAAFGVDRSDKELNAIAKKTFEATLKRMIGVPANTAEDAIAALEFIVKDTKDCVVSFEEDNGGVYGSLMRSVRDYIEGRAA